MKITCTPVLGNRLKFWKKVFFGMRFDVSMETNKKNENQ